MQFTSKLHKKRSSSFQLRNNNRGVSIEIIVFSLEAVLNFYRILSLISSPQQTFRYWDSTG